MPRICITELLHEVAQETGFLSVFTNLRTGEPGARQGAAVRPGSDNVLPIAHAGFAID